ncbi:hypothetical protein ACNF49_05530 [Actinomadura sp. ATCC 39365]|uniref:hypothetical protein n=1 Tax=Nonomuraea sp. NPDC005692 TaxID=3157168 RepID=UPI0033C7797A
MNDPYGTTRPAPRHAAPQTRDRRDAQGIYREEALRHRAMSRVTRMPPVISTPSFLALWLLVAVLLVTGLLLTMVAVEAVA